MGCDIHGVFQKLDGDKWVDVPTTYEFDRHYQLFAVLADVRNDNGVEPIAEPRGLPEDFVVHGDRHPAGSLDILPKYHREHRKPGEPMEVWMGQHSFSWLSAEEMLSWYGSRRSVEQSGVIDRHTRAAWDGKSRPKEYFQGVCGQGVVVVDDEFRTNIDNWTHVRVTWESNLQNELAYFFDEVKRLSDEHGQVRFVFGFDS